MPDLGDTNPDNVFKTAGEQPSPTASSHDHPKQVRLKDHRGHLRPPAYILITLVIALVAVLLLLGGVMLTPREQRNLTRQAAWTAFAPALQRSVGPGSVHDRG